MFDFGSLTFTEQEDIRYIVLIVNMSISDQTTRWQRILRRLKMKQTNVTHNIRVDKNKSNRMVFENWDPDRDGIFDSGKEYVPIRDFGMAMVNRKRGKKR